MHRAKGDRLVLELQRFTEIVSHRDTFSDDMGIVSYREVSSRYANDTALSVIILEMN